MVDDDEEDDTWSDTFENPQSRFQDLDITPKNTLERGQTMSFAGDMSGDKTPTEELIRRPSSPMHHLVAAATKLNESVQLSPGQIQEKAGSSVGMYPDRKRSDSLASVRSSSNLSRPGSRGPNPYKRRPAPPIPQAEAAVTPASVPLQYPRSQTPKRASRPTSPAFDLEKASVQEKTHFAGNYPLNTYLPSSRPGSRMASSSRDSTPSGASSQNQPIKIKETPMKIWNPPRSSIVHEPSAPVREVDDTPPEEPSGATPPSASGSSLSPGETSKVSTSPSKCPHCTIHSWLPHSQNCPKWKGLRRK